MDGTECAKLQGKQCAGHAQWTAKDQHDWSMWVAVIGPSVDIAFPFEGVEGHHRVGARVQQSGFCLEGLTSPPCMGVGAAHRDALSGRAVWDGGGLAMSRAVRRASLTLRKEASLEISPLMGTVWGER